MDGLGLLVLLLGDHEIWNCFQSTSRALATASQNLASGPSTALPATWTSRPDVTGHSAWACWPLQGPVAGHSSQLSASGAICHHAKNLRRPGILWSAMRTQQWAFFPGERPPAQPFSSGLVNSWPHTALQSASDSFYLSHRCMHDALAWLAHSNWLNSLWGAHHL